MSTCGNYGGAKNTFTTNGNNKYTIARSVPGTALPETPSLTRDIGSSDYPFDNLYVNEIHVTSDNTIYLGTKGLKLTSTDAGEFNLIMDTPPQPNDNNTTTTTTTTTLKFTSAGISSSVKTTDTSTGDVTENEPTDIGGGTYSTGTSSEIESLQSQITTLTSLKAPKISPTFTGIPLAPTAISSTNTTQIATTEFVKNSITDLIGGVSSNLDTLSKISTYLTEEDSRVTIAMTTLIETKVSQTDYDNKQSSQDTDIASRVLQTAYDTKQYSQDTATSQNASDILTKVSQDLYDTKQSSQDASILSLQNKDLLIDGYIFALQTNDTTQDENIATLESNKAPKISPTFTGIPLAPTAISSTNTTQIATTEFVKTVIEELINNAPETLDTLKELAAAFSANESAITTTSNLIGEKLPISTYNTDKTTIDGNITTNTNAISAHAGRLTTLENLDIQSQIDTIVAVDVVQQNTLDIKANISNQTMDNLTSRQTINIAEKILPLTVSSGTLTANYANGAVFFVSNLTAAANWECLVTNVNPTSSTGCSNVITLLIDASVYHTFAATCKINGTTRTLQFAGGIDAVDMTGATTICQTISVVYSGGSGVPIAVLSSVVPFF